MFRIKKILFFLLKWTITILAVGNLLFLFVFDYQLPNFLVSAVSSLTSAPPENETLDIALTESESDTTVASSAETETAISSTETETSAASMPETEAASTESESDTAASETTTEFSLAFQVSSEPLSYDGSSELNLLEDVAIVDASGTEQTNIEIFSTIKPGRGSKEKIIEYSATTPTGERITAERILNLGADYIGPVIELLGEVPTLEEEELSSLLPILLGSQLIKADDGFGREVSSSVTASIQPEPTETDEAVVTLHLTNLVNDSFALDVTVPLRMDGPLLRLTTSQVTLKVGDTFSFYEYIASAEDADGNSLHHLIQMRGAVDTSKAGTYVLEFFCTDPVGNPSPVKTLTVIVEP